MDEVEYYRSEARRFAARVEELKSSWSYRLSAPVRLVERAVQSLRKRSIGDHLHKLRLASRKRREPSRAQTDPRYRAWIDMFDTLAPSDGELIRLDIRQFARRPLVSVAVAARAGDTAGLSASLASLAGQLYRDFEVLVIGDDVTRGRPAESHAALALRQIAAAGSEADNFNAALAAARGELLLPMDAGDALAPEALYVAARALLADPAVGMIYGDEDELASDGERRNPFFKPDWNPELALAFHYVGRPVFFRTETLRALGGARPQARQAWHWDLVLRMSDTSAAARAVHHLPWVLLHRSAAADGGRKQEIADGHAAVTEALARRDTPALASARAGWFAIRRTLPKDPPHVTIVVPTRDGCELLRRCLRGILARTDYPSFDVVIVDNCSSEPETLSYLQEIAGDPRVRVLPYAAEFNFARLHNTVVPLARGDLLAFLNNDLDVIGADWLAIMVGHALDETVGAVGAKLYYPDDTVQHAGVVLGLGGIVDHIFRGTPRGDPGPRNLLMASQEFSAVTAACLVIRRSVYLEVGGMDETFAVDYNDIDLCLRLRGRGYRIVWAANAELYHHESATRKQPEDFIDVPERAAQFARYYRETGRFRSKWRGVIDDDPFYNPNLTVLETDRSLAFPPRAGRHGRHSILAAIRQRQLGRYIPVD